MVDRCITVGVLWLALGLFNYMLWYGAACEKRDDVEMDVLDCWVVVGAVVVLWPLFLPALVVYLRR